MRTATHSVYTPRLRDGKFQRWLEIGSGRIAAGGVVHVRLDRMLIDPADFTGYLCLTPVDREPIPPSDDDLHGR